MGPQTTKEKGKFQIDLEDDAVQNMLISYDNEARWPDKITPYNPPLPPASNVVEEEPKTELEIIEEANAAQRASFVKNAGIASLAAAALLAFGLGSGSGDSVALLSSFALAGLAGYQVVWGVAPALHSPLMAVTNAVSGMTAVGGMLLLAHSQDGSQASGSLIPDTPGLWLGALATVLSFVNISGGFLVSGKMLDLFRRPTDPDDSFELYALPVAVLLSGLAIAAFGGVGDLGIMSGTVGIASAICCIAGIAALASQKTARTGNVLAMTGVTFGLAATTADMSVVGAGVTSFEQVGLLGGLGSGIGAVLASGVGPAELPQTVAAFHPSSASPQWRGLGGNIY